MQRLSSEKLVLLNTGEVALADKVGKDDEVEFRGEVETTADGQVVSKKERI